MIKVTSLYLYHTFIGSGYIVKMNTKIYLLILISGITTVQTQEKPTQNPCLGKHKCHECIQTPSCAWCSQPGFEISKRCYQTIKDVKCLDKYRYDPDNVFTKVRATNITTVTQSSSTSYFSTSSEPVQLSPQEVNLKLRINQVHRMSLDYSQAAAYPIDLYYLMDLSKSMSDDIIKLSELGKVLADAMKRMTSNFKLGFGSFVDKPVMPYISIVPNKLSSVCGTDKCVVPYGFKNHMSLNSDTHLFTDEVRKAKVSTNIDSPEGGFDAIMQAVVCRKNIGWRDKARKLLVFSTDAVFHFAGDGKLGGIMKPNDGECHLDEYGLYTHSASQDYPSISQINTKVKQNAINIIFAVTQNKYNIYKKLSSRIEGSYVGILSSNSDNIVELVEDQYNAITSSVEMKDTASKDIKVTYYSNCNGEGKLVKTNKCDGLKVNTQVKFQVEIVAKSCPTKQKDWKQTFQIYPVGINESLTVNLEFICDCDCEHPGHSFYVENADSCSKSGIHKCGVCECYDSYFGEKCECGLDHTSPEDSGLGCRPDNTTSIECSGRGTCICGQCQCEERPNPLEKITGPFCECENFSCDRADGLLCSGLEHGKCVCGKCECNPEWSGPDCSCSTNEDSCRSPGGGEICLGKGICKCGRCECFNEKEGSYLGTYCEKCTTCPGRCIELKDCVQCHVYKMGPLSQEECVNNCTFVPSIHEFIKAEESDDEKLCTYIDENECRYKFVYTYNGLGTIVVRAEKDRDCPQPVYVLGIAMGVVGAIVFIGLTLLLMWKLFTTIHDRREYAKFEKERMMAKWGTAQNPIYKQATSSFQNPTYTGH